jgi:hypothetical protein
VTPTATAVPPGSRVARRVAPLVDGAPVLLAGLLALCATGVALLGLAAWQAGLADLALAGAIS